MANDFFFQIDLQDIAEGYEEMFEASLVEAVKKETSDEYGRLLMKLLGASSNAHKR